MTEVGTTYIVGISSELYDGAIPTRVLACDECKQPTHFGEQSIDMLIDKKGIALCESCGMDKMAADPDAEHEILPLNENQLKQLAETLDLSPEAVRATELKISSLSAKEMVELIRNKRLAKLLNERGEGSGEGQ